MKLYAVIGEFFYECSTLIGVFSSEDKAQVALGNVKTPYDSLEIEEITLDEDPNV